MADGKEEQDDDRQMEPMIESHRRNYLFAILILAFLLFNAPLVIVMDALGGGGWLPAYLFAGWSLVILLAYLVMRRRGER